MLISREYARQQIEKQEVMCKMKNNTVIQELKQGHSNFKE